MLKLPYIPARDYRQWFKVNLNKDVPKAICRQIARIARRTEQRVLGKELVRRKENEKPNQTVSKTQASAKDTRANGQ